MKCVVRFDSSLKKKILSAFDKDVDSEGFIIEENSREKVLSGEEGENIKLEDFAGIKKGSQVFIKSDLASLLKSMETLLLR